MRIIAKVRHITGLTRHTISALAPDGSHVPVVDLPPATQVIIEEDGYGYPVLLLDDGGMQVADEWSPTLEDAKAQALSEFGIVEADWRDIS
jgi:hypothetical protein